jgi:NAD(P)-dependent dehydrogenase (short-subunit alcohol dehydrogenase family)
LWLELFWFGGVMASRGVLAGRVALITGAASGIGRATAELFAEQGAAVVVADVNDAGEETVATITAAGGEATFVQGDVSVEADVEAMVQAAESVYGGLDAAFNNAGITDFHPRPFEELSSESFDRMIAINLRGVWLCMKHELAVMVPRGRGTIVNTSSVAGLTGTPRSAPYTASKHGVIGLTRTGAVEHGLHGIRVNAIAPGFTRSGNAEDLLGKMGPDAAQMVAQMVAAIEQMAAAYPLGRMAEPREMAEAALWLTSPASSFVTGHVLVVDGGFTAQGESLKGLFGDR